MIYAFSIMMYFSKYLTHQDIELANDIEKEGKEQLKFAEISLKMLCYFFTMFFSVVEVAQLIDAGWRKYFS